MRWWCRWMQAMLAPRSPCGRSAHTLEGNVHHGDVISHKTENSYCLRRIRTRDHGGVKDLRVVQTKDAVLIADRNAVQDVKKVVEKIVPTVATSTILFTAKCTGRGANTTPSMRANVTSEAHYREAGRRPVGTDASPSCRALVVVAGTAKVTIDGEVKLLGETSQFIFRWGRHTV